MLPEQIGHLEHYYVMTISPILKIKASKLYILLEIDFNSYLGIGNDADLFLRR